MGGEAHGWARQPYGRFDLSRRPGATAKQRHPTFALTRLVHGGAVWLICGFRRADAGEVEWCGGRGIDSPTRGQYVRSGAWSALAPSHLLLLLLLLLLLRLLLLLLYYYYCCYYYYLRAVEDYQ